MSKKSSPSSRQGALTAPVGPAQVTMNLTKFVPIATGNYCVLGDPSRGISPLLVTGNGIGYLGGDPNANGIVVKLPVPIRFNVSPFDGLGAFYSIVGCIFVPKTGKPTDKNFTKITWNPTELTFKADKANLSSAWKFFVAITDSNSVLGIIDPEIENDSITSVPPGK